MSSESGASGPGSANPPIHFGQKFAESENFSAIFKEGMGLVEATAAYLDSDGREDAKNLEAQGSLAYARESMRLTTRLMQIASWLLIRRAVNDGELTPEQAVEEKTKVKLKVEQAADASEGFEELPERLKELITSSLRLNERLIRLDRLLNQEPANAARAPENPLGDQFARLRQEYATPGLKPVDDAG